jgi:hypothetical protein
LWHEVDVFQKNGKLPAQSWFLAVAAILAVLTVVWLTVTAEATPQHIYAPKAFGLWRGRQVALALLLMASAIGLVCAFISRNAGFSYIGILTSIFGTLLVLELVGRIGLVDWPNLLSAKTHPITKAGIVRTPNIEITGHTSMDTASQYKWKSEPIPFHYKTDRDGFRNAYDRPGGDIYLVGDSMLVGNLLPFDQTVAGKLESTIGKAVKQVALLAHGPQDEQAIFLDGKFDVSGKLVLQFIFEGNDLGDSYGFRFWGVKRFQEPTEGRRGGSLINRLWLMAAGATRPQREKLHRTCLIGEQLFTIADGKDSFQGVENERFEISKALQSFAQEIKRRGGEFAVVFIPTKYRVLASVCAFPSGSELADMQGNLGPLREHLTEWAKSSGVGFLDLTGSLQAAAKSGRIPWFWGDSHWNAIGNAAAVDSLVEWSVMQRYLRK